MNACSTATRISKPVSAIEQPERERQDDDEHGRDTERRAQDRERHQDEVPGEHVGEEPDGERERPDEERRDELDGHDEEEERPSARPAGSSEFLRYRAAPCFTMPTML